jgi:rod shape-determining protein MreC
MESARVFDVSPLVKRYRDIGIVVILLAVPFFFLRANMKKPENLNAMDRAVLTVSEPVERGASGMARGVSNLWSDYVYLVDVKADNQRLAYDNARLREEVHKLSQYQVENQQLKRLLSYKESMPMESVSARVSAKDFNEFFRVAFIHLDAAGRPIKVNAPVITADGVVGKVLRRGTGDPARYACKVEMVDSNDVVEIGDLLVTSGKGKWFPRGIPVAKVTKVTKRELGRDQEVEAAPTVDFARLDAVLVLVGSPTEDAAPAQSASAAAPPKGKR